MLEDKLRSGQKRTLLQEDAIWLCERMKTKPVLSVRWLLQDKNIPCENGCSVYTVVVWIPITYPCGMSYSVQIMRHESSIANGSKQILIIFLAIRCGFSCLAM